MTRNLIANNLTLTRQLGHMFNTLSKLLLFIDFKVLDFKMTHFIRNR